MQLQERYPRLCTNAIIKEGILHEFGYWINDQ